MLKETLIVVLCLARMAPYVWGTRLCCNQGYGCIDYDGTDLQEKSKCPSDLSPRFLLYTKAQNDGSQTVTEFETAVPSNYVDNKGVIFIVHGFNDKPGADWLVAMKNALLNKKDTNVIVVDWQKAVKYKIFARYFGYSQAAANTYGVALALTAVAKNLVASGTPQSSMWCIGHSLGAHLCGHAGTQIKFGRITGLDPAGLLWDKYNRGLDKNSATFVDVIHTDGSGMPHFGLLTPLGHADFYPDEGHNQPGCAWSMWSFQIHCSHMRSVYYFTESVSKNCFKAKNKCTDYNNVNSKCPSVNAIIMGYGASSSATGLFYVPVQKKKPYCVN